MESITPPVPMPSIVIKAGGGSKGITIKRNIVKLLKLKPEQVLVIEFAKKDRV